MKQFASPSDFNICKQKNVIVRRRLISWNSSHKIMYTYTKRYPICASISKYSPSVSKIILLTCSLKLHEQPALLYCIRSRYVTCDTTAIIQTHCVAKLMRAFRDGGKLYHQEIYFVTASVVCVQNWPRRFSRNDQNSSRARVWSALRVLELHKMVCLPWNHYKVVNGSPVTWPRRTGGRAATRNVNIARQETERAKFRAPWRLRGRSNFWSSLQN